MVSQDPQIAQLRRRLIRRGRNLILDDLRSVILQTSLVGQFSEHLLERFAIDIDLPQEFLQLLGIGLCHRGQGIDGGE